MNCVFQTLSDGRMYCPRCGYLSKGKPAKGLVKPCAVPGWGDRLESLLSWIGITMRRYTRAKQAVGLEPTCGCKVRKQKLNEIGAAVESSPLWPFAHAFLDRIAYWLDGGSFPDTIPPYNPAERIVRRYDDALIFCWPFAYVHDHTIGPLGMNWLLAKYRKRLPFLDDCDRWGFYRPSLRRWVSSKIICPVLDAFERFVWPELECWSPIEGTKCARCDKLSVGTFADRNDNLAELCAEHGREWLEADKAAMRAGT
jgi:hypothetical protein